MTIKEACEIAKECGLETIGEAIYNIELHACNIFAYGEISEELEELHQSSMFFSNSMSINDILKDNN